MSDSERQAFLSGISALTYRSSLAIPCYQLLKVNTDENQVFNILSPSCTSNILLLSDYCLPGTMLDAGDLKRYELWSLSSKDSDNLL